MPGGGDNALGLISPGENLRCVNWAHLSWREREVCELDLLCLHLEHLAHSFLACFFGDSPFLAIGVFSV